MEGEPLERVAFDAGRLILEHPPRWNNERKRLVFEIARSSGFPFEGHVIYARWRAEAHPPAAATGVACSVREGVFDYSAPSDPATVAWYLNFADPDLFCAYGSSLLAQDELQVAEHPILGSLCEALNAMGRPAITVDEGGRPTPVTITGVQRRCVLDTMPNPQAGRHAGLYGNAFGRAPMEQLRSATTPLSPPTISNILAIAAPPGGDGEYSREEMLYALNAAYTGFSAARREGERLEPGHSRTVIHTGFWGCGAFGGNRTLMTVLQALAADLAGVELSFWAVHASGVEVAQSALVWYGGLRERTSSVSDLLDVLVQQRFRWGVSNGT